VNHLSILSAATVESSRVAYCHGSSFVQPANFQTVTSPRKAIVIVDDEKAYIDIMATMLTEQFGCPVITFTRPLDALAALPNLSVGIIVTDCNMPQFSGYEFIRRASALLPGVPFILMTGNFQDGEEELTSNSPLRSILPKPFGWKKLADEIISHAPEFGEHLKSTPASPTQG
jgi:CheY-like chemotaxis protein